MSDECCDGGEGSHNAKMAFDVLYILLNGGYGYYKDDEQVFELLCEDYPGVEVSTQADYVEADEEDVQVV